MKNKFLFLVLLFILSFEVFALGVSPGRTTINFEPSLSKSVDFQILNTEKLDGELAIAVQGELKEYVKLKQNSLSISSNIEAYSNSYVLNLPEKMTPGMHSAEIVVLQLPKSSENSDSYVGAALAVVTQVYVYVPYPGKYIEADSYVYPQEDGSYNFVFSALSRGQSDIVSLKANVDIYDSFENVVSSFTTNSVSLKSQERTQINYNFKEVLEKGTYKAKINLIYDGEILYLEKSFTTLAFGLELQDISVNDFTLGQIAKLELLFENKMSSSATNAYAEVHIFSGNSLLDNFKSSFYDIPSKSKSILIAYWDTAGVREGTYDTKVYLKYEDNSIEKNLQLKVSQYDIKAVGLGYVVSSGGKSGGSSINFWLILGIVVLILMNLLWFLLLRKKLNK